MERPLRHTRRWSIPMKKINLLIGFFILFIPLFNSFALDTDLYVVSSTEIPPNVLIMFDNSASMNEKVSGAQYDPSTTYPFVITEYSNRVYYRGTGGSWNVYRDSIDQITCNAVKTALTNEGFYTGRIRFSTSECGTSNLVNLRTGNYMNYMQMTGGSEDRPKLGIAKGIIQSYVNTTDGVRFGAMIFNYSEGGRILKEIKDMTPQNRADLHAAIGGLQADTWTPLAETLYEAGLYFKGAPSHFNPGITYASPVQYYCQKNYVIIITDGESTMDRNSVLNNIGDQDGDGREPGGSHEVHYELEGSDYLDDVAKYLYENDFNPNTKDKQNIITYTIGFTVNSPLLERTAKNGGGKFFYCHNAQSFIIAFQNIIEEILSKSISYVAPVVPISQMERASAGNRIYLAMFKPTTKSFWKGNIKKYGIATANDGSIKIGDILDANGSLVMDAENKIKDGATSYWSSEPDGEDVEKGGVGEILYKRTGSRKIYTYLGTNTSLADSSNAFVLSNSAITSTILSLTSHDTTERDKIINFIHGLDSYDENGNGITNEKRDWILGAFIHSRPLVIHYGVDQSVIYAGANDGMLHAFDDASGGELWAFIPPSFLTNLKNLNGEALEFFVDGAPKVYMEPGRIILVFGLRRGGNRYIALDITDRLSPKFLWEISPSTTGYQELGQTWSTPQVGKIKYGSGEKWVAFIGGGYDENQDKDNPGTDSKGRAIYFVDVLDGSLVKRFSNAEYPAMTYSIPSDIAKVDTDGNGKIDRLYVGDMGGRMWRFDIGDPDPTKWDGKIIFNSNLTSSDQRKIFYPPDVTLENDMGNYEMLLFGTGDREHPKESVTINRLYTVKDKNLSTILTENDLENVTQDLLQDPNATNDDKMAVLSALKVKQGWYIQLDPGEKCLSSPVVFYKITYYSTFAPSVVSGSDPCQVGEGSGRIYLLKYKTGNAAFNLDLMNDIGGTVLSRSNRSINIGFAIPSGVIITFVKGAAVGYIGVGGGVYTPQLASTKSLVPINWRIVF
jgi:type IV pilus assembly protein PilY1